MGIPRPGICRNTLASKAPEADAMQENAVLSAVVLDPSEMLGDQKVPWHGQCLHGAELTFVFILLQGVKYLSGDSKLSPRLVYS